MYDLFLETLESIGIVLPKWFFWIVLIFIIFFALHIMLKKYVKPLVEYIQNINDKLSKTDQIEILKENQLRNVEDYKTADKEIRTQLKEVSDKVSVIATMILEMQSRIDETNRAKLKDRIRESYGYYHPRQKITKMELEALEDLIRSYEAAGGKNSFCHSIVEPEMYTWEVIDSEEELDFKV